MTTYTNKHDEFLAILDKSPSVFVGDSDLPSKLYGVPTGGQYTLRYMLREADRKPILSLVIKHDDPGFLVS